MFFSNDFGASAILKLCDKMKISPWEQLMSRPSYFVATTESTQPLMLNLGRKHQKTKNVIVVWGNANEWLGILKFSSRFSFF